MNKTQQGYAAPVNNVIAKHKVLSSLENVIKSIKRSLARCKYNCILTGQTKNKVGQYYRRIIAVL